MEEKVQDLVGRLFKYTYIPNFTYTPNFEQVSEDEAKSHFTDIAKSIVKGIQHAMELNFTPKDAGFISINSLEFVEVHRFLLENGCDVEMLPGSTPQEIHLRIFKT